MTLAHAELQVSFRSVNSHPPCTAVGARVSSARSLNDESAVIRFAVRHICRTDPFALAVPQHHPPPPPLYASSDVDRARSVRPSLEHQRRRDGECSALERVRTQGAMAVGVIVNVSDLESGALKKIEPALEKTKSPTGFRLASTPRQFYVLEVCGGSKVQRRRYGPSRHSSRQSLVCGSRSRWRWRSRGSGRGRFHVSCTSPSLATWILKRRRRRRGRRRPCRRRQRRHHHPASTALPTRSRFSPR